MGPDVALPDAEAETVDPDDLDYGHHDRETLDLGPVLREQIILSLPITVLCDEACRGLCPACGADLNAGPCTCVREVFRAPFAVLKNLKV